MYDVMCIVCFKGFISLLVRLDKGIVFAAGDNKLGQLGLGMKSNSVHCPTKVNIPFFLKR